MACQPAKGTGVASSTLLQMPTQVSQIWTRAIPVPITPGPPMSRVTSWSDLPQKEHFSFGLRLIAIMMATSVKEALTIATRVWRVKEALTSDGYGHPGIELP